VGKLFPRRHTSVHTKEFTQERNPMNVVDVEKLSLRSHTSEDMKELTQEKNPISATYVGRLLSIRQLT
jgi:hypothetical protein